MNEFFKNKNVLVTGGSGFVGRNLVRKLLDLGAIVHSLGSRECDLTHRGSLIKYCTRHSFRPKIIIHLAAMVGGIQANQDSPADFFYNNMMMGLEVLESANIMSVDKLVLIGTVCSYPKFAQVPFRECGIWSGFPEETNAPYGIAKRSLLVGAQAYRQQYGLNSVFLIPTNMYGPRDNFDPRTSHVIPAIIRKCKEAKIQGRNDITLFGNGSATRDFLYVDDAVDGIVEATKWYNSEEPVNLGTGVETSIRDLSKMISEKMGCSGIEFVWDCLKPNGQPRRCLDVSLAKKEFGFEAKTTLDDGLSRTINWFNNEKD